LKEVQEVYEIGLGWSLDYFETIYKRLGTKFDGYYPESWVGELGMKIVEKGLKKGVLSKSKGAVVYEGEQDGLHTRVFVNKLGLPTYEAKDLGLAEAKYQDFKYDLSLNIFGKEIDEYYKVVKAALRKIEPELGKRAQHLAHGMVNLPEGKMSSRTGNIITCEWLLNETKKRVLEVMQDTGLLEKDNIAEMVAQGAVKYAFLKNNIGDYVIFDFGSSISFQGNSGPYIQYTYARARSVLARAKTLQKSGSSNVARGKIPNSKFQIPTDYSLNDEEMTVLSWIYRYPELVEQAAREYAPHLICTYLYELAQRFNAFYNKHSILGILEYKTKGKSAEDMKKDESKVVSNEVREFRLCLTVAVAQVLKNGLHLLGIQAPEKM
jgi:arginyl-tRNA synthetase